VFPWSPLHFQHWLQLLIPVLLLLLHCYDNDDDNDDKNVIKLSLRFRRTERNGPRAAMSTHDVIHGDT